MYKRIGVPQVVEEPVAQSLALMCARYQSCDIKQFYGYRALAIDTGAVVGRTSGLELEPRAGARYLQVADGALGIYRCEREVACNEPKSATILDNGKMS
jgi:hypothetical protein